MPSVDEFAAGGVDASRLDTWPSRSASDTLAELPLIRDIPVRLVGGTSLASELASVTLHYRSLQIEGPMDALPESIDIDLAEVPPGGELRIRDLALPQGCEVIGIWFENPLVSRVAQR